MTNKLQKDGIMNKSLEPLIISQNIKTNKLSHSSYTQRGFLYERLKSFDLINDSDMRKNNQLN